MTEESNPGQGRALIAIRVASLWLLAGALLKLFAGTPFDLPQNLVDLIGKKDIGLFFHVAIAIELTVVALVWLKPKLGWFALAGNYAVFICVLIGPALAGDEDCGCGGSLVSINPILMIVIDGTLLAAIFATRPWSRITSKGAPILLTIPVVVLTVLAPWIVIPSDAVAPSPVDDSAEQNSAEEPAEATEADGPRFVVFDFEDWYGKSIYDADFPLTPHLDGNIEELSPDGNWIFWRITCSHCATHLRELTASYAGEPLVLIRDHEEGEEKQTPEVTIMPEGPSVQHVSLRKGPSYFMTTPVEMIVAGGEVLSVEENVGAEEE